MGVTITATNSNCDFDMGYGGFLNLRRNIAFALDKDFGNEYSSLKETIFLWEGEYKFQLEFTMNIINKKHLDDEYKDVLDFLFMPDTEGKISYKTCRKIAGLLESRMSELKEKSFRYAAQAGNDYEDFVKFLKECVRYHRNMRWF